MELNATNNPENFYRNKTMQVLEKWGVEGEVNEVNLRKAASSFARMQKKNSYMKYATIGSVLLLAVFMGMMIASVVIGTEVTKDFKVKEQVLVTKRNGAVSSPVSTSEMFYSSTLNINTPLKVIQGVKRLKFNRKTVDGKDYVFEFDVVSFYYSQGRKISLYGHTHMANILPDGSVEIFPITTVNGAKRYDTSKRDEYNSTSVQATTTTTSTQVDTRIQINTCDQLVAANNRTGSYLLTTNLTCTLSAPLFPSGFAGIFDGNMNEIFITLVRNGPVGLFQSLEPGANVTNIILNGTFTGTGICGSFAVFGTNGAVLDTATTYANITCSPVNSSVVAGGLVAVSTLSTTPTTIRGGLLFTNVVSQGIINLNVTSPVNSAIQGGLWGLSTGNARAVGYTGVVTATYFTNPEGRNKFGYKSDLIISTDATKTRYVPSQRTVFPANCTDYWNWDYPDNVVYMANLRTDYFYGEGAYTENEDCCYYYIDSYAWSCVRIYCPDYKYNKICMQCRQNIDPFYFRNATSAPQIPIGTYNNVTRQLFSLDNVPIVVARRVTCN